MNLVFLPQSISCLPCDCLVCSGYPVMILLVIMEGIVVGIAQINFHTNLSEVTIGNCAPNLFKTSTIMSNSGNAGDEHNTITDQNIDKSNLNCSVVERIDTKNKKGCTFAERRQMPTRASKESSLLGIKRRTIVKPVKRIKSNEDGQNLTPSDIKKIYLNKKVTKFKPSSLETIFEENFSNSETDCNRLIGGRKIRRVLSFSDGFRCSKTLLNKRRAKIKKNFGKRFALKKVSLEEFITKLNTSIDKNEVLSYESQMEDTKTNVMRKLSHSLMLSCNDSEKFDNDNFSPSTCLF